MALIGVCLCLVGMRPACAGAPSAAVDMPARRTAQTMDAMFTHMTWHGHLVEMTGTTKDAFVWPYGQALAAALDQARLSGDYRTFDRLEIGLERYRKAPGEYASQVNGRGDVFYDDNVWLGLVFIQAWQQRPQTAARARSLAKARSIYRFIHGGLLPNDSLPWKVNDPSPVIGTCEMGPAVELALRLHLATASQARDTNTLYFQDALRMDAVMERALRLNDGPQRCLYIDSVNPDLTPHSRDLWAYNQGVPIGANTLFYRITGDSTYLTRAQETADAALSWLGQEDRLWHQPPIFNAIFFRNLLQLDAASPDDRYRAAMQVYADRAWQEARDVQGIFVAQRAGFGHFEKDRRPGMIDQAGMAQVYALLAWPETSLQDISTSRRGRL